MCVLVNNVGLLDRDRFHSIPGAPAGVVAMRSKTDEKGVAVCETCHEPIAHPSNLWCCGAGLLKPRKGVRHPDGMVYWHDECLDEASLQ